PASTAPSPPRRSGTGPLESRANDDNLWPLLRGAPRGGVSERGQGMGVLPPTEFYESLIAEFEQRQEEAPSEQATFFDNRPMTEREVVEFLEFQAYYERRAAEFIGGWLSDTPESDAFVLLA